MDFGHFAGEIVQALVKDCCKCIWTFKYSGYLLHCITLFSISLFNHDQSQDFLYSSVRNV